ARPAVRVNPGSARRTGGAHSGPADGITADGARRAHGADARRHATPIDKDRADRTAWRYGPVTLPRLGDGGRGFKKEGKAGRACKKGMANAPGGRSRRRKGSAHGL